MTKLSPAPFTRWIIAGLVTFALHGGSAIATAHAESAVMIVPPAPASQKMKRPLFIAGLTLFLAVPVATVATAVGASDHPADAAVLYGAIPFVPVLGQEAMMWIEGDSAVGWCRDGGEDCDGREALRTAGWAISGAVQAAGLAMMIVGLHVAPRKLERLPVRFSAAPMSSGGLYLNAAGRF